MADKSERTKKLEEADIDNPAYTDTGVAAGVKRSLKGMGNAVSTLTRRMADKIGQAGREAKDEMKRETRGMKKGGMVSASKRADGCAVKGKTRGKMV